jgi:hypothetical protein
MNEHLMKNWLKYSHEIPSKAHPFNSSSERTMKSPSSSNPGPGFYNPPVKDIRKQLNTKKEHLSIMLLERKNPLLINSFYGCLAKSEILVLLTKKTIFSLVLEHIM